MEKRHDAGRASMQNTDDDDNGECKSIVSNYRYSSIALTQLRIDLLANK